jgi:hypothetical protein
MMHGQLIRFGGLIVGILHKGKFFYNHSLEWGKLPETKQNLPYVLELRDDEKQFAHLFSNTCLMDHDSREVYASFQGRIEILEPTFEDLEFEFTRELVDFGFYLVNSNKFDKAIVFKYAGGKFDPFHPKAYFIRKIVGRILGWPEFDQPTEMSDVTLFYVDQSPIGVKFEDKLYLRDNLKEFEITSENEVRACSDGDNPKVFSYPWKTFVLDELGVEKRERGDVLFAFSIGHRAIARTRGYQIEIARIWKKKCKMEIASPDSQSCFVDGMLWSSIHPQHSNWINRLFDLIEPENYDATRRDIIRDLPVRFDQNQLRIYGKPEDIRHPQIFWPKGEIMIDFHGRELELRESYGLMEKKELIELLDEMGYDTPNLAADLLDGTYVSEIIGRKVETIDLQEENEILNEICTHANKDKAIDQWWLNRVYV